MSIRYLFSHRPNYNIHILNMNYEYTLLACVVLSVGATNSFGGLLIIHGEGAGHAGSSPAVGFMM